MGCLQVPIACNITCKKLLENKHAKNSAEKVDEKHDELN